MNKQLPSATILVAADDMYGIGYKGGLPWHNPRDLAFFKRTTENQVVIMGRKTWESLPKKPLSNRENYVLSNLAGVWGVVSDREYEHTYWSSNLLDALIDCESMWHHKQIYIIGGRQIYDAALQLGVVKAVIISHIHGIFDVDTYFPPLCNTQDYQWRLDRLDNFAGMTRRKYIKDNK